MSSHQAPLKSMLEEKKFVDLRITCKDQTFMVHRVIICGHSKFFDTASVPSTFRLPEDDPELVRRLIDYAYTGKYTDSAEKKNNVSQPKNTNKFGDMLLAADMYKLADKFMAPELKAYSLKRFKEEAERLKAWPHSKDMAGFSAVIDKVYNLAPPDAEADLRPCVIGLICGNVHVKAFWEGLQETFGQNPDVAIEVMDKLRQELWHEQQAHADLRDSHDSREDFPASRCRRRPR
ncbi:hypothetical protein PgNI_06434 [Pyricularia grisea]|uniref:BTB domain-containing protein n=1 Tax=Pyricularia grisea TaxID=148305 RepID=A0A6P8B5U5_PYRGI|nr:hypothetical protein PgNI_06434 [Pyricularia grisea]TLD10667.1 hypothetical protein PgNI_06434 [Pyricularia grisea]